MKGKKKLQYIFMLIVGGLSYFGIEMIYRGRSHFTMGIVGGLCFLGIFLIDSKLKYNIIIKAIICSVMITTIELLAGIVLNIYLQLQIWNYTRLRFNILGQVSLLYSALWIIISFPAIYLSRLIQMIFPVKLKITHTARNQVLPSD